MLDSMAGCMRRWTAITLTATCGLLLLGCVARQSEVADSAATPATPVFTEEAFMAHIRQLASDELEGRGLNTPGIHLAAGYVAGQFAAAGLEPGGDNGTYFQGFTPPFWSEVELDTANTRFTLTGVDAQPVVRRDYIPFGFSASERFNGDVVFAGYGIVNPDKNHDDYAAVNVKGKVVLVLRREPPAWHANQQTCTWDATYLNKLRLAKQRGAAAVLVANKAETGGQDDPLAEFEGEEYAHYGLPAFHVKRALADQMLAAGGLDSLDVLEKRLNEEGSVCSAKLEGVSARGVPGIEREEWKTWNVVGILRGEGPLAHECVVIGAHYDHLGIEETDGGSFIRQLFGKPKMAIHNGADDNASGTSGVIELARAFAGRGKPRRTVIFVAFSAEEYGLYGSEFFVRHPIVRPDNMVAMVNLDMIGRLNKHAKIEVFGGGSGKKMKSMLRNNSQAAGFIGLKLHQDWGHADQTSFHNMRIPAVHFFTGMHSDYHQPTDDIERINAAGGVQVLGTAFAFADALISRDERVPFDTTVGLGWNKRLTTTAPAEPRKVKMGIFPDFQASGDTAGVVVQSVTVGDPAALAGIRAGDRIVQIDGEPVANINEYLAALEDKEPGDVVEVVAIRGDTKHTWNVTLTRQ